MKKALFFVLALLLTGQLIAQTGTEFWLAPPEVTASHGDQPIFINVTTLGQPAVVTISQPANPAFNGGVPIVLNLAANSAQRYDLTLLKVELETRPTNTVLNTGLRISATSNITCYYEPSYTNNPDIAALKGANGLGTEFYIPLHKHAPFYNHGYAAPNKAYASFDIVATENNTVVMIYSPVPVDGHPALTPFTVDLNIGQTYSCAWTGTNHTDPTTHPSGAVVLSDKPVAISIKDDSNHNPSGGCYDLMLDQIVPVNILGTDYVAVKGALNATGDESLFVMAVQNNTQVYIDGSPIPVATLFAGQYYRHDMDYLPSGGNNAAYVSGSKPLYAIHVTGFGCEQGMAILPPLNCAGSTQLSFTRSTSEAFFLNLLVRNGSQNDFVVTGPGTATIPGAAFQTVPGTGGEWMAARIQYNTTQVPVNQAFIVSNTSDVFSLAIINGGGGTGCRYGFFSEFSGRIDISAGSDQTRCAGDSVVLAGTVSGGSTTGIWTTTGSGTFAPSETALNASYHPSIGDLAIGAVTLTLTSTGPCEPVDDAMVVTFSPKPIPNAGPDQSVCRNNAVVQLAGSMLNAVGGVWTGGAGAFLPSNSNLNATYTPTAAELTAGQVWIKLTSTGNGVCSAVPDSMLVTFTPTPTANAGPDQTRCANNSLVQLNGAFTVATGGVWSGGSGSFDPSTTNMSAQYTPDAAEVASGSVTLTMTTTGNGNCVAVNDQVLINFTAAPVVNAGAAVSLCANNAVVTLNGSVTGATGGAWSGGAGSYTPDNTTLNATYTPTAAEIAAGTLTLTLSSTGNGNCVPVTSNKVITFTPAPTVNAGANGTVCANNADITLAGSFTLATGAVWSGGTGTYNPNNTTMNAVYTPSAAERTAGTVILTLTTVGNANCNAVSANVSYAITPAPTANAGVDQTLCANNAVATLNGSFTVATGGVWSGGAGSFDPSTTNMGAQYTPTPGEISSGSVILTLTTTGIGGCLAVTDQVRLNFTAAPVVSAGSAVSVCANNVLVALNGSVTGATGGAWSGGTGSFNPNANTLNASYTPSAAEIAAGTVTLTLSSTGNGNCNAVPSSKVITITSAPVVSAGSNGTVCTNNSVIALNGSVIGATGGIWSGGTGTYNPNNTTLNATYTPSAAERTAGTVTLTLTSAGNGNCNAVASNVTYTITPAPTANAGADQSLCTNNPVASLGGSVTIATGGIWSGGAGTFAPSTTNLNATYTPTAAEIASGLVTLTLTTTGNGTCIAVIDQVQLNFTPSPAADAGADLSLCRNNASVALGGSVTVATGGIWSGGAGSYTPNNTTLNATYTPTPGELAAGTLTLTLTTTGTGNCNAVADSRVITFTPSPTVNAGPNATVCANNSNITLAGAFTVSTGAQWTGGAGTYNPNNTTMNAVYTPTAAERTAGTVTLTLTTVGNGNCSVVNDQVTFTITPAPTANAGPDRTVCANNAAVALNGSFTIATGGVWSGGAGTFDPSTTNMGAVYTPSAAEITAGIVTLTLTTTGNGSCIAVNDQMVISITDAPTVNAGAAVSLCANNSQVSLSGSVIGATGGIWSGGTGTFNPNNTSLTATYTPTAAEIAGGTLTLTLTSTGNGNCNPVMSNKVITFTPSPIVNAGANGSVCTNNATISLNGSVIGATGAIWSGGTGTYNPNNTTLNAVYTPSAAERTAGTVTLTLTSAGNGNCNAVSSNVTYSITPAPTTNAGADQSLCSNNPVATLNGSFTVATGGIWSGGNGSFSPSTTNMGATYTPTAVEIANGNVTLTLTTTGNGTCIAVTDQVQLSFTASPTANAGPDLTLCRNNASVPMGGLVTIATGGIWSGGAGSFTPNNTTLNATYAPTPAELAAGTLTLTLTTTGNGNCNSVSDSRVITFTPAPTVNAGPNATVCANNSAITLAGAFTVSTGVIWSGGTGTYNPNNTSTNAVYTPSAAERAAGTATLTLTTVGNGNCSAVSDQVTFTITPAPTANAGLDRTVCANNVAVALNGSFMIATGGIWSGGAGTFDPSTTNMGAIYTPSAAEITAGIVTLTLTTSGNGTCNAVTDQMVISITDAPTVNAGAPVSLCANNAQVSLNGSVFGATGGAWTGGSGTFAPNNTTLSATYTPSASDLAAGTVTLTLTSTGNGNCNPVSSARIITFTPAPTVNAGPDASVCSNNANITLAGAFTGATGAIWSGGTGTYNPNNTTLNAVYTPSAAERIAGTVTLTLSTVGNGSCNAVGDAVTFTITPSPTVNAGVDRTVCANNVAVTLSGSSTVATGGMWSGGNGTFDPSTTNMSAIYTASAAEIANGSVTLTLTTTGIGNCVAVTDQMTINFTAAPVVNAGAPVSLCANNAQVSLSGSVTGATGGVWSGGTGTYSPNNSTLTATYTPTAGEIAGGTLTLTLTSTGNGTCNPVQSSRVINFTPAPSVNAGPNGTVCANSSAITLAGSQSGATGAVWSGGTGTYNPNNATLNAVYTPSAAERTAGTVTLTLTTVGNGNCNAVSDQVTYSITPSPTANAGPDQSRCANNAVATLTGSVTVATGGVWSGGAGAFTPSTTNLNATYTPTAAEIATGSVTLTLTTTGNNNCVAVLDQITIDFTPAPVANAGTPVSICVNNPQVTMTGSVSGAPGGIWSGGLGSFTPNNTTLNAVYTPTPAELAAGTLTLTLTTTGNGNCNAVASTRTITFTPAPVVDAGANGTVCSNASLITLNGSVSGATGAIWSGGAGVFTPNNATLNTTYQPTTAERNAGTVTLTLTSAGNGNCNAVSDQVTFSITPAPTANAGVDQSLCSNNAVATMNGSFTVATGGIWSGGAGTFSPSATLMNATYTPTASEISNGSVTLTLTTTGNNNCVAVADQVLISFTPSPSVDAGIDVSVCRNNAAVSLSGTVGVATGGIWSGGAGSFTPNNTTLNATYTPTPAELALGTLTLTLTSTGNGNCNAVSDSKVITFTPAPTVDAGANGTVCANNSAITLAGALTGASGVTWSGGTGTYNPNNTTLNAVYTPSAAERTAGTVTLTLTTTGNGNCNAVNDQVTYSITAAPTANAGADRVLCANNAATGLSGAFSIATGGIWSGGAGTFDPSTTNMSAIYTPTAAEIAAGSVTLTLTTTGNGLCNAVTDQVLLTFTDPPSANAGANVTRCANNAAVALGGSVVVATGGTWTGGTGTFSPNANTLNATYNPGAGDLAAGQVTLTLTTTGNGNCAPATSTKIITYTPAPIVNAGTNGSVCANAAAIALNGTVTGAVGGVWSGGAGSFSPNNITLNATYTPTAAEITAGTVTLTLTSAGNGLCNAVTNNVTYTITPAPTVNAGVDQSVCGNNATATLAAVITVATGVQWSGGTGVYSPGSTAQNITYSPSPIEVVNGSVTLIATTTGNGTCAAVNDAVTITYTQAPIANAGPDQTVSSNNANTTLAGSFSIATGAQWTGGAGTYNPNSTTMNAVYSPTPAEIAAGSVTLTLITTGNASCSPATDQMTITFGAAPTANAGPDQTVCANNPALQLNGGITIATGGIWSGGTGTYNPGNSALNAIYTPSAAEITAGTVTLTLTSVGNGNSNPVSDQITITITPAPIVNAGVNINTCANQSTAQLTGVVNNATGGVWSGGSGTFNPSNTNLNATYTPTLGEIAAGTVTLTLSSTGNGLCNGVSDQVLITIAPAPVVNAGVDQTVCANNSNVQMAGSVSNAGGGIWSGGTGTFSPSINALNAVYTPSTSELANGSVTITLSSTGNGSCASVSDQMTIFFSQSPVVNAGLDRTVCANDPTVILNGSVTIATGGVWSGGGISFTPNATTLNATYLPSPAEVALGTATLTLTSSGNGLCNSVNDQMVITIIASPSANAGSNIAVCSNNAQVQLGGSVSGAGGGQWSGGAGTFTPSIASLNASYTPTPAEVAAGTMTLTLTTIGNGNCVPVSDNVLITFTASPTASAGTDGVRCANNAGIQLNGSVTVANGGTWSGAGGTFTPNANALNATYAPSAGELAAGQVTLTLTTTGNNGCTAVNDAVSYTFTPAPTANAGSDLNSCANNASVALNGAITVATGGLWTGGSGGFSPNNTALNATYVPSAAEIAAGTATLTLTTVGNGLCSAVSDQVVVTIAPSPIVDAGTAQSVCANNATLQLNGSVLNAAGGIWTGGGIFSPSSSALNATYTPSAAEIAAGVATLTLTSTENGLCSQVSDQVAITITPAPVVEAGAGGVYCMNNSIIQLAGSITVASGGTWSGAQGGFSPNANTLNAVYTPSAGELAAGSVTLTLTSTGNNGCIAVSDVVSYTFTPAPTANAGSDLFSCANNAAVALNGAITVATGALWSGGNGTFTPNNAALNASYMPSVSEIAAGTVSLTLTTVGNGTCSPVSDQVVITITPSPIVDAGAALTSCANNPAAQLAGSVQNATGGIWSGAGTFSPSAANLSAIYTPSAAEVLAGSATITLTSTGNGLCNAVADQVVLTITAAPIVEAGTPQSLCANNAVVHLGGQVINATGGTWSGGAGAFMPNASALNAAYTPSAAEIASGQVWLFLTSTGNGGCLSSRDSVQVQFTPAPTVNAGPDAHICANAAQVSLNGVITVATGGLWTGGTGSYTPGNTALNATYFPSAAEIASGQFTLVLRSTGNGNCTVVRDSLIVLVDPVPVVNAGPDQQICANNSNVQLNGFVGNAPGGAWSGGAGIFFPSNTMLATQYAPTAAAIAAGSLTLTLSSTGTAFCPAVTDQMTIVFTGSPIASAGNDLQICANNSAVQLTGNVTNASGASWTGGSGAFAPNANVLSPVYTPSAGELAAGSLSLYLTSTGNGNCIAVRDTVVVTFTPAPTVNAGADLDVCMNNPVVTLNGAITVATGAQWTGGLGTFTPNAQALNAQYVPNAFELGSGSVQLTLTTTGNGNCIAVTDQVTITVTPSPVVSAGADLITCSNQLQVPLSGTVQGGATSGMWSTSGTGVFSPSPSTLNATYIASSLDSLSGTVDLTLTSTSNGLCNAVSDVMTITILPNAIASAGVDQTVCSTTSTIQLNGTITGNATQGQWTTTGAGSFSPSASAANAVYQIAPGDPALSTLTFTWSVNSCDNAMDQMVLTITPESVADAGADQVTCFGDLDVVINGSISGASNSGTWSTLGSGTFANANTALSNIYQASANDQLAGGVNLVLTATNTGVCAAAIDTMFIAIQPAGTVNAGLDVTACANNAVTVLTGTLSGDATQVQWTTSGTGSFFPNANVLTPTYIPSAIDTAIGSVTLTLTAPGTCNNAVDDLLLTLTPAPYVNAGPDQTYCDQVTQFDLNGTISGITNAGQWTTNGTGTIANAGALNTTYIASAADVANGSITFTLTSLNNANCNAVTDAMTIYLTSGLIVSAGPDQNVCVASDHANMLATVQNGSPSGIWTATGSGTFQPSADVLNAQYFFSAGDVTNGSVVLTFTATNTGTCPVLQDQMVLTFGSSSFAYAGADQALCANSPIALLAGNFSGGAQGVQWSSAGSGFFSNSTNPNATYTLSAADIAAGQVNLTLTTITGGSCLPASDVVVIAVNALPNITAGADIIACTAAPVQVTANAANAGGGMWTTSGTGTFFDPNALATLYTPSAADSIAGTVTLTVTTTGMQPCSAVSDQLVISFGGGLDAAAGMDIIACSTDPNVALNGVVAGTTTGTWTTSGTGSFMPNASSLNATYIPGAADYAIGNINLILSTTNNQGCPAGRDTLVVSYHVPPTVNAGVDLLLCSGLENVQLNGNAQNQGSVQWITMGTGSFTPDATALNATYVPTANDSIAGGVYLVLTAFGTGTCANASDSVFIDIGPTRIANAGSDQTVCADMDPIALGGSIAGVSGGAWSTNGTGTFLPDASTLGATYVPSATDMVFSELRFILTTTGNMGCPADVDTMMVALQAVPTVSAGNDINVCDASATVDLSGAFTGANGVLWSSNGSGFFLPSNTVPNAAYEPGNTDEQLGTVRMILTTTGNGVCAAVSDTVMLSFVNPLQADFTVSNACAGSQTQFTSTSTTTGAPIIGWNWSFGNGASGSGPQTTTSFDTQGQYLATLTVFAQNGCSSTVTRTIDVLNAPVAGFTITGDPFTDTPMEFTDNSFGATNWQYDFGDDQGAIIAEPVHEYTEDGQFIIIQTVTNAAGCTDRDSLLISIAVKDILPPKLPNAFSPNGDGVNDVFYVRGGPFETMHLKVYNGWGEMIFETTDPTFGWDGTHEGKPEINGVYVYSVIATTTDGTLHDRSGKMTLIR
ncbi:MAG: gliding motility-associated C-terminal domain-containing protein [Flavobacteriales bacterium]|nr:gliding motility-associated C-terminal domain-containing protein [Flavobacteriales bacterium]